MEPPPKKSRQRKKSTESTLGIGTLTNTINNGSLYNDLPVDQDMDDDMMSSHNSLKARSRKTSIASSWESESNLKDRSIHPASLPKAKPIFVDSGFKALQSTLTHVQVKEKITFKFTSANRTQVLCGNRADKASCIKHLAAQGYRYYTFAEPHEKPITFVLKGVGDIYTKDEIASSLKELKLPVIKVSFLVNTPGLPIVHLVQFERGDPSFNFAFVQHKAKAIGEGLIVRWELFDRAQKRITQCHKCQQFGHAATHCTREFKCVKCTDKHDPGQCARKSREVGKPKCVNCAGDHTANSRICPKFIAYQQKIDKNRSNRRRAEEFVFNSRRPDPNFHHPDLTPPRTDPRARVTAQDARRSEKPQPATFANILRSGETSNPPVSASSKGNDSDIFADFTRAQSILSSRSDIRDAIQSFNSLMFKLEKTPKDQMFNVLLNFAQSNNGY